jgi:hypothetical protein
MLAVVPMKEEKAMEHAVPPGLDPNVTRREIVIEADVETLEKMRKEGRESTIPLRSGREGRTYMF